MNTARRILLAPLLGTALLALLAVQSLDAHAANVKVSRFWHNHQPIYWPEWNNNIGENNRVQFAQDSIVLFSGQTYGTGTGHPWFETDTLEGIFGKGDRVTAYQSGPRNSLAAVSQQSAGYAMSYSGSLIEDVRSLGRANNLGYGSGWYNGYREAMGWSTPSGSRRMDMVGFTYHHSLGAVMPKSVFRKEIQIFKQAWWKAWNKNSDLSDHSKGFFPTEMAFTTEMIDVLRDEGYEWVIVASHHLSRTCPTYTNQPKGNPEGSYNIFSSPPNKADQMGPSPSTGWWFGTGNVGETALNVSPFAYQLHKVKYVNPATGAEKTMIAVPSDDIESYKAGYSGAQIGMINDNISPYATDANNPAIVLPATDGDNAWGGGSSSWMESTPAFFNDCQNAGYAPTAIQDFVNQYGNNATVAHVEDGAWIFPETCYGSPYFLKWVEPPLSTNRATCYSNTIVDLETPGFSLKFWSYAPIMAGANWCETAEQILEDEGGTVADWKIATPYDWDGTYSNPNEVERAWHIFLAGLDSGFNYYGGLGNDDEVKPSLANRRAIEMLTPWMTAPRLANDRTPPTVFRPQRFPWNPGAYTFGWFNSIPGVDTRSLKKMGSDFYVWTHAYDVSGIPAGGVVLKIRRDLDGANSMANNHNETYAGGSDVEGWISIPMTKRALPNTRTALNAAASNGQIDYFITPAAIADYYFAKVTQFRDALVDYYIEATDAKGNVSKSDIQHVYVVGDGTDGGVSPSATFSPAAPADCAPITVNFNAATSALATAATVNAFYHFSTNNDDWVTAAMTRQSSNTFAITFATNQIPDNAPQLEVAFNDGVNWANNGGANWKAAIRDCDAPEFVNGVNIVPGVPTAGQSATVSYDPAGRTLATATNVNIHYGYNGSNWTDAPGAAMAKSGAYWTFSYTVPVAATSIVMCFNNGTTWDNNGGNNWTFAVNPSEPPPPVPNGVVITNPAVGTATVANAISNYTIQGTAGTNLSGSLMTWTNALSGQSGTLTRQTYWSLPAALAVGDNAIAVAAVIAGTGAGTATVAVDSAAAYASWTNGSNQGAGFGPWMLFNDANAGHFTGANGFGLWSHEGTNLSEAIRPFSVPLATGQTFRVHMKNGWIWESGGSVGVALRNTNGATLWQLYFNGGDTYYNSPTGATDIGWTDAGLDIGFTVTAPGAYTVEVQPVGGTARQYVGTFAGEIAQFRAWSYNNGTSDTNNSMRDYFVDNLRITSPVAGGSESYSTATVHIIREGGGNTPPTISDVDTISSGGGAQFHLSGSISGAQYALYASPALFPSQHWQAVGGTVVAGTGGAIDLSITNGLLPTNYYRVGYTLP